MKKHGKGVVWKTAAIYIAFFVWYMKVLFLPIQSLPDEISIACLLILCAVFGFAGLKIRVRQSWNIGEIITTVLLAFELYTVLSYWGCVDWKFIVIPLIGTLVLCLVEWNLIYGRIKRRRCKDNILSDFLMRCAAAGKNAAAVMFLILMAGALYVQYVDCMASVEASREKQTEIQEEDVYTEGDSLANNMEILRKLRDDIWYSLGQEEKVHILQVISNIEGRYLGLSSRLKVTVENVEAKNAYYRTDAYYNEAEKTVVVNSEYLSACSGLEAVTVVCHECRHSYQQEMMSVYDLLDSDKQNLRDMRTVGEWKYEQENYVSGDTKETFEEYYDQKMEEDAREYAQQAVEEYRRRVFE